MKQTTKSIIGKSQKNTHKNTHKNSRKTEKKDDKKMRLNSFSPE